MCRLFSGGSRSQRPLSRNSFRFVYTLSHASAAYPSMFNPYGISAAVIGPHALRPKGGATDGAVSTVIQSGTEAGLNYGMMVEATGPHCPASPFQFSQR
jgi:hypothetical protein